MAMQRTMLLIPGTSYFIRNLNSGNYLSNTSGTTINCVAFSESQLGLPQEWILESFGNNVYAFVSRGAFSGWYIDMSSTGAISLSVLPPTSDQTAGWKLQVPHNMRNVFSIVNEANPSKNLKENSNSSVSAGDNSSLQDNELWELFLADVEITTSIVYIEYDTSKMDTPAYQKTLLESGTINNNSSSATVNADISITKGVSSSFSWSFTESITLGISSTTTVEGDVSVPMVATAKVTEAVQLSESATLQSSQVLQITENTQYSASMTISVPPGGTAAYNGYVNMVSGVSCPFTSTIKITARTTASNTQLSGSLIEAIIRESYQALHVGNIPPQPSYTVNKYSITFSSAGTFTGGYGVSTAIEVTDVAN